MPAVARLVNRPPPVLAAAAVAPPVVQRRASGVQCQAVRVSSPGDAAELEARRVARRVVSMPAPAAVSARSPVMPQRAETAPARPGLPSLPGGGSPLPEAVRSFMAPRFRADFSRVRIHTDAAAAGAARQLRARAFTVGERIYFAGGEFRPETAEGRELIAHELTHTIQQGAAPQAVQPAPETAVAERSGEQAQRWDLPDPRRLLAERAAAIPGFTLLSVIIGRNPISGAAVARSPGNLLRGAIELMPAGVLVTQALTNHGIFERAGAWVEPRFAALRDLGASLIESIRRFIADLGVGDLLDPVGVWNRARNLVSGIIDRVLSFARSLASGILELIREAILRPLAGLAAGTRGWELLCAVLGRNPISGEAVPRTAATLIGGFMRLIGQEEVWQNIQRGNAVGRAWAWFQGALAGLAGFVGALPGLFVATLRSLGINDLLTPVQTFGRVVRVFGDFAGRFVAWGGAQVMRLLEIICEVVAPAVMPYLRRAGGALRTIIADPVRFIGHLVQAGVQGLRRFAGNILRHLGAALLGWLGGVLAGASVYIPQALTLPEIVRFVLSVLGLTWQNLRARLVRVVGEAAVAALERGFDLVVTLVRDGPAAAWERIRDSLADLRERLMAQIMDFVRDNIVVAAITRLVASLNPAGAFIQAIVAIYNTVTFFVERLRQIAQVAAAVIDSLAAIAGGAIASAAGRIEQTMAGLLTLVISFLARLLGLGRIGDAIAGIVSRIRAPIERALDRVVDWVAALGRRFLGRDPSPRSAVRAPVLAALGRELRGERPAAEIEPILQRVAGQFRAQGIRRLGLSPPAADGSFRILAETNPTAPLAELAPSGAVPRGRRVQLNVELTLASAADAVLPTLPGSATPLGAIPEGARTSTDAARRDFNQLAAAHPGATTRSRGGRAIGGIVLAPSEARVQLITWNTGSLDPDTPGNQTHAERQFDHWVDQVDAVPEGQAFLRRVSRIDLFLRDYSPCGTCCSMLRATRRKFPNARSANLHWVQLYTGRADPTRWHNLGDLRDWQLHAPGSALPVEGNPSGVRVRLIDRP